MIDFLLAERGRFELPVQENRTPLFESGTLNHSDTSPSILSLTERLSYAVTCYTNIMPRLNASLGAMRAISVATATLIVRPALIMIGIIVVAFYCLTAFLALSFSAWWWLMLVVLVPLTLVILGIGLLMLFLLRRLTPRGLRAADQAKVDGFAQKLLGVVERSRYSYPVILFLIAKDIVRKKESSFLRNMIGDSRSLTREFGEICRLFER